MECKGKHEEPFASMMKFSLFPCLLALLSIQSAHALDLMEAYQLGLQNDPLVRKAEAQRNAAEKYKPIGIAKLLPSLAFTGNLIQNDLIVGQSAIVSQAFQHNEFWSGQWSIRITQPLFHYDAWARLWQADAQLAQAEAQLEAQYQDMAVRVAKAYFGILAAGENVEFSEAELRSLESQLDQVKEQLAVGIGTVIDLNQFQAQRDKVSADLILAQQQFEDAREALREIIGDQPIEPAKLPSHFPLDPPEPNDVEKWRENASQNNLNIIAASSDAEIAKRNIDVGVAGHLPSLDIIGEKSMMDTNRPTGTQSDSGSVGVYVTVPIFAGGGVQASVEQSRHFYEQALFEVDRQRRFAERQVKNAFRGILSAIGRVAALKAAVKSSESAVDAAQTGYQVGTKTVVDILIEQSKLFANKRDYAQARYDYLINGFLLKQASGTLQPADLEVVNTILQPKSRVPTTEVTVQTPPPSGGRLGGGRDSKLQQYQDPPSPQPPPAGRGSERLPTE